MRILTVYPHCSLGGMTTVYLNRSIRDPQDKFDFIFLNNAGGKARYEALPNVDVRIVNEEALVDYLKYVSSYINYHIIRVCSLAAKVKQIASVFPNARLEYEIHAPHRRVMANEIRRLNDLPVDKIICPSEWQKEQILNSFIVKPKVPVVVFPNIVNDYNPENYNKDDFLFELHKTQTPLLWIGRATHAGIKNYHDFFQILASLPAEYFGVMVLSLETDPQNVSQLIGLATQYSLIDRIVIFMNIDTFEMAGLYEKIKEMGGAFCSTSLYESYGYAAREALLFQLPVVAYKIGPFEEINDPNFHPVALGDIVAYKDEILNIA